METKISIKKWGYKKNINGSISKRLLNKFSNYNFDYVIHCAGGTSPITSQMNSISKNQDYKKNVVSIKHVLDNILINKKNKGYFYFISSSVR